MKFKHLLFSVLTFSFVDSYGQVEKQIPTEAEWQSYFYAKQNSIQKKLYLLVREGKLKGYKNDSLKSTYSLEDVRMRGSTERLVNKNGKDTVVYDAMQADALMDFWFCKQITSSPFNEVETNKFTAVVLTFQPVFGGFKARVNPYCWLLLSDLKLVLDKADYDWLLLVFYYSKNDNKLLFRSSEWGDAYWELNHVKGLNNITNADSILFQKMGQSFASNSFYIDDYWYHSETNAPYIYDHQQKKKISHTDFEITYKEKLTVFIQTDINNPEIGIDSVIYNPRVLNHVTSLTIDKASKQIKAFNFEIRETDKDNKILKFSMDADIIRKSETLTTLFWFFEDYYRWRQ